MAVSRSTSSRSSPICPHEASSHTWPRRRTCCVRWRRNWRHLASGTVAIRRASPWDFRDAAVLVRALRRERVSLVHSHLFVGSLFASPLARLARVRAVVETLHLPEVWRMSKRLKRSFWLDRQVSRSVDRFVAVSAAAARHLIDNKGIPAHKVRTIFNGRDLARFHPASTAERREARAALGLGLAPAALLLGRLEPQKGHALMLEAAARPGSIGARIENFFRRKRKPGASTASAVQQRRSRRHGDFSWLSRRSGSSPCGGGYRGRCPSLYEGLPWLAAIEAMAAARPVVVTDIEGIREVVIDGSSGLLVRPWRRARSRPWRSSGLVRFPKVAQQLAANGRRRGRAPFRRAFPGRGDDRMV